ncbi:hypothetical protein J437_LFUL002910 [Ladona fulva]|uniref:Uncharacterized protein n=1 Tax=Ladona fulva TaxID=123851 RepID=A0A8K0KUI6_LADFU|nr:hypothetical protein J437_LFUL002910 [Ladona fulva]
MAAAMGFFLIVLSAAVSIANAKSLPNYISICHRSNKEELIKCGLKNTVDVQPHIANGVPEINVPPMDPLTIPEIKLQQGTQAVNYKCTLSNVKVRGLSQYKFVDIDSEMEGKYYIRGKVSLPQIYLDADYEIDGKVLLVPIKGEGLYKGNYTNTIADINIDAELVDKKGKKYLNAKSVTAKLEVGNSAGSFENLFSGDSTLTQATNSFLNENSKDLQKEILPAVEEVVAQLIKQIINQVFDTLPYEELFPK